MSTKLLKSVLAAIAVLGASVGFATDYTLTQSGTWSDPATWGLTEGYPNSVKDNVNVSSSLSGDVTVDLEGNTYGLLDFVNESSHIVTLKNGTISADTTYGDLKINTANGGLAFEDGFTYTGNRIWPHNLSSSAATSMSFKNGTFNGNFSLSGFYGAGTFTMTADNAIVKHTQASGTPFNTLAATIVFDVKLGANNVEGGNAAIQFLGSGYSGSGDSRTLTVDCSGKTVGKYAIIKAANGSDKISALATNGKATASNVGSGLTAAFSWDSTANTLYLTLSDAPVTDPTTFYGKGGTGYWTATAMWTVDEGGLGYPSKEGDKVYFNTSTTATELDLNSGTYALDLIENTSANDVVIKNGTLDITNGNSYVLNSGSLTLKNVTLNLRTDSDDYGYIENVANNAVLGFEGDNTLNCCRFRGSSTVANALSIINVTNGATAINAKYIQRGGSANFRFNVGNATLTLSGSEQVSFLAAAMVFNLTLGDNNTTSSDAMIKMVCSKTFKIDAAPTLTVNATGKSTGSYKLITIPVDNAKVSGLAGTSATVDDGKTGIVKWDTESYTLYLEITEKPVDDRPLNSYVVKQSGNWNLEGTWYHNSAQTYPGATGTAIASPETPSNAVVNIHSSEAGVIDAKTLVVSNDCTVTFKGTVSGAYFRVVGTATDGSDGILLCPGSKTTLDSVGCGNSYSSFYTWLNGSAELAFIGACTFGSFNICPNGSVTDGYPTLSVKDGTLAYTPNANSSGFISKSAFTMSFDNATMTSSAGLNFVGNAVTWNVKMGATNTTSTAVYTSTATVQATARPKFVIDMTGKKTGTYPIIAAPLGGEYCNVGTSDFTVTRNAGDHFSVVTDKNTGISINFEAAKGLMVILR